MKTERLGEFLDLYKFSLGSIAYCVDRMRSTLEELGNGDAVAVAEEAQTKHQRAARLQWDWDQQKKTDPLDRPGTFELDNRIDQTLSNLLKGAEVFADLETETERQRLGEEFVEELFPSGVFPITSKTFDDQRLAVDQLLERLETDYAEHVDKLNLGPVVDQLEQLNAEFADQLEPSAGVSYDEVEAARAEAEDAFHRLMVRVMNDYAGDMETFNRIVEPVHQQTERTRRHLQRRGTIPEVDPETGEPVSPDEGNNPQADGGSNSEADGENNPQGESDSNSETDGDNSPEDDNSGDGDET